MRGVVKKVAILLVVLQILWLLRGLPISRQPSSTDVPTRTLDHQYPMTSALRPPEKDNTNEGRDFTRPPTAKGEGTSMAAPVEPIEIDELEEQGIAAVTGRVHKLTRSTISSPSGCVDLILNQTAASSWLTSVKLCRYDPSTCGGEGEGAQIHVLVANGCESTKNRALSKSNTLSEDIKAKGPDTFRLRLDGPEVHLRTSSSYTSPCHYTLDLPALQLVGSYNLAIERLYKDYHALDEVTKQWPRLLKEPLLPVDPTFRTQYHLQQCTLPSLLSLECTSGSSPLQKRKRENTMVVANNKKEGDIAEEDDAITATTAAEFTENTVGSRQPHQCTGLEEVTSGHWIKEMGSSYDRSSHNKLLHVVNTRVRVKKIQRNPILFQWAIQPDAAAYWKPDSCEMPRLDYKIVRSHLKGKKMVVGGDSQSRGMYYSIANYLAGYGNECLRNITGLDKEPGHCVVNAKGSQRKSNFAGLAAFDFVDDHFLDKLAQGRYNGYDYVIIGFAQHPASKEHWSFDKYKAAVTNRAAYIERLKKSGSQVVWMLAPQYPHTRQGYPVVVKDWRTDERLKLFNTYSKSTLRALGIPVLDTFAISTPMGHSSPDQAHFTNFVAYEFVQMLFNMVCVRLEGKCTALLPS